MSTQINEQEASLKPPAKVKLPTNYRWTICALLFFATTINYIDRQLFSNLIPFFEDELRMGPFDIAFINVAFLMAYGFGMIFIGRYIDRIGTKRGLASTFTIWNFAAIGHALVTSVGGFGVARFILGVGEAGNFPSAIKTVAEWFPKKERALATGWFNCGSNIGAVVAPPLTVFIATNSEGWIKWIHETTHSSFLEGLAGWRVAFVLLGSMGLIWLYFWNKLYSRPEDSKRVSPEELAYIQSDNDEQQGPVPMVWLFNQKQLWAIALARFFSDSPWWMYLFWTPKFLKDQFHLPDHIWPWAIAGIYLVADFGAILGGLISTKLIAKGHSVNFSRKMALLTVAIGALPVTFVGMLPGSSIPPNISVWIAVGLLALAASSHQGWSSNMYTVISDTLPKGAVAMTVGVGTAFAVVGSSLFQLVIAASLVRSNSYALPFMMAGSMYLIGLAIVHLILPKLEVATYRPEDKIRLPMGAFWAGGATLAVIIAYTGFLVNKPPYDSVDRYFAKHAQELQNNLFKKTGQKGEFQYAIFGDPQAKEGDPGRITVKWQNAFFVAWKDPDGKAAIELIVQDRDGRPSVDTKNVLDLVNESGLTKFLTKRLENPNQMTKLIEGGTDRLYKDVILEPASPHVASILKSVMEFSQKSLPADQIENSIKDAVNDAEVAEHLKKAVMLDKRYKGPSFDEVQSFFESAEYKVTKSKRVPYVAKTNIYE